MVIHVFNFGIGIIFLLIAVLFIYFREKSFIIFGFKKDYKKQNPSMMFWGWYVWIGFVVSALGFGVVMILKSLGVL